MVIIIKTWSKTLLQLFFLFSSGALTVAPSSILPWESERFFASFYVITAVQLVLPSFLSHPHTLVLAHKCIDRENLALDDTSNERVKVLSACVTVIQPLMAIDDHCHHCWLKQFIWWIALGNLQYFTLTLFTKRQKERMTVSINGNTQFFSLSSRCPLLLLPLLLRSLLLYVELRVICITSPSPSTSWQCFLCKFYKVHPLVLTATLLPSMPALVFFKFKSNKTVALTERHSFSHS